MFKKKTSSTKDKVKKKRAPAKGPFVCYALEHSRTSKSYTGQTNNFHRRLRQHNGEIKGGARYTSRQSNGGKWNPLFKVCGFQTLRSVLQFEIAMKKRKVPLRFRPGIRIVKKKKESVSKTYTRGPSGRVRQLEFLMSLGRLNGEAHSHFATNGIHVEVHMTRERYLKYAGLTYDQFEDVRRAQGVPFYFVSL